MNLPEDFFLNFISGLFTEANVSQNNPAPKVKPNKESPSQKELNKLGEIFDAFSEKYENKNETTSHSCLSCNKIFLSYKKMKAHMVRSHENGNYKCSTCNIGFSSVLKLKNHVEKSIQRHTVAYCATKNSVLVRCLRHSMYETTKM